MVAVAQRIEVEQPDVAAENRVWDFSGASRNCVRPAGAQVAECDLEMTVRLYDWRRGPSLAQRVRVVLPPGWTIEQYLEWLSQNQIRVGREVIAAVYRPVPGHPDWEVRQDPSAGGGDPPHDQYRKRGRDVARRVYNDGSQRPHGKGDNIDVPKEVIDATPPNPFPGPEAPKPPQGQGAQKNAFVSGLFQFGEHIARVQIMIGGPLIMPPTPEAQILVLGGTLVVVAPPVSLPAAGVVVLGGAN